MDTRAGQSSHRPSRRFITTHDQVTGKSVYINVTEQDPTPISSFGAATRSYSTPVLPAQLADDEDLKAFLDLTGIASYTGQNIVIPGGANLILLDLIPGAVGHMHRTVSLDFSICVKGEIEHELDSGEKVRLLPGDHIIQRGTMHRWLNASKTDPARLIAVILPCQPFELAGQSIEETHLS
ncbi:hypothetical protein K505DRAFT_347726 [Melanomma pulvis-pyrius CBS 109.77]|uniref:Cupin type-2 domain-containing protein n=1 Tax=Melanomma pulvis-pyrius CBS 109.77 TaxID=1314802 RepID=A0A6A6XJP7_9PLEO|nr:hypothetical protein K505DRAFT_347726 [Melanomma pulvis-pyrius CBS 109.77]